MRIVFCNQMQAYTFLFLKKEPTAAHPTILSDVIIFVITITIIKIRNHDVCGFDAINSIFPRAMQNITFANKLLCTLKIWWWYEILKAFKYNLSKAGESVFVSLSVYCCFPISTFSYEQTSLISVSNVCIHYANQYASIIIWNLNFSLSRRFMCNQMCIAIILICESIPNYLGSVKCFHWSNV